MNIVKQTLLYALAATEHYKGTNVAAEQLFHKVALEIYSSTIPSIKTQVVELIDEELISRNGNLTFKGKLQTITNIHEYGPNHLGIQTIKHLRECMRRGLLGTQVKGAETQKGVLSFLRDDELASLLELVLAECFERVQNGTSATKFFHADSAAYIVELNQSIEEELTIISGSNEVIDLENKSVVEVESVVEEKPKKSRKKTVEV